MRKNQLAAILLLVIASAATAAPRRGENLIANPSFEQPDGARAKSWAAVGKGYSLAPDFAQDGHMAILCEGKVANESRGVMQEVAFNPPLQHPFMVSGWSKAENAQGDDYCLYIDCWYADGTNLWGQRKDFAPGSHDWQRIEYIFPVTKPVTKIQYFVLFRRCTGRAWFDNLSLALAPFCVEREKAIASIYGGNSIDYSATLSMPAQWTVAVLRDNREVFSSTGRGQSIAFAWNGTDSTGQRLPGANYTVRLSAKDDLLGDEMRHEKPIQTLSGPGKGYVAWVESSMQRVLINSTPEGAQQPPAATISLARNEYESFQIALRAAPDFDLKDCRVESGDLKDSKGHIIPAANIEWHVVGFVHLPDLFKHPKHPVDAQPGWWPDPLLPMGKFSVPRGVTQALWFTLYAPPDAPAGDFTGSIKIIPANAPPLEVGLATTIYDFAIPTQPHIKTAFALMDGFLEKLYGKLTPELRRAYGDYVLKHRLNPDDISRTDPPDLEDIAHYYPAGLNAFNVINMVEPRGKRTWVCYSELKAYTPEFKADLVRRLDPYVAELRRRGLLDKAYLYTFDERGKEFWPVISDYFGLIKERYRIPTLTTAKVPQDPQVMKDLNVDWNCPVSSVYKYAEAERCRKAGLQVWSYICCGPRFPFANWLADDPLIEARVIWWQTYQQKMDGFLYWGLNIWSRANNNYIIDPEKDGPRLKWSITTERFPVPLHGDGDLLYPGKDGPFGCIRLANIRDGIEDYEYLWLLAKLDGGVESARTACRPVTLDLKTFTRDPARLYSQRHNIARKIEQLMARYSWGHE